MSSLIAFLLYAFELMGPITELTQNVTSLQSGIAAAARIRRGGRDGGRAAGAVAASGGRPAVPATGRCSSCAG